jgi:hypothetical protein
MANIPKLLTAVCLAWSVVVPAEAAQRKYWYLKYETGQGSEVSAFKSKASCEAGIRYFQQVDRDIVAMNNKKEFKRLNPFGTSRYRNLRCLSRLPYGYLPPAR